MAALGRMDAKVVQLIIIAVVAFLALVLAWRFDHNYFAIYFATVAAIALGEAVHRSL